MRPLTLEEVVAAMNGRLLGGVSIPTVTTVSIDSRTIVPGSLFFAITGPRHDGHDYVNAALEGGAVAAVVREATRAEAHYRDSGRVIVVNDPTEALGRLAAWYRRQFAATVIAVVGSNGKTTTKDLIFAVLSHRRRGRAAPASHNNHIGVPLTLLSVEPSDEFVVVEIGTNHPGEVMALGRLAQPDMVVVTSIGEEHLEFFGDLEAVAAEEFSVLATRRGRGFVAVSEQAASYLPGEARDQCPILVYGFGEEAALRATQVCLDGFGQHFRVNDRFDYYLPAPGLHNVSNALAAIAVGTRMRLEHAEMAEALRGARLPAMRMDREQVGSVTLINDAYNANPSSVRAALEVMNHLSAAGRKVLILGDMRELGNRALSCHQEIGREAGKSAAQVIVTVGAFARVMADGATATGDTTKRIYWFPTVEAAAEKVGRVVEAGDVVLLKASRGVQLERLLEPLRQAAAAANAATACKPGAVGGR